MQCLVAVEKYKGEPYSEIIKFPSKKNRKERKVRELRISVLPNVPKSLENREKLWICRKHFSPNCEWVTVRGGRRPNEPQSIFDGIPKSCLKQVKENQTRTRLSSSSEARAKTQKQRREDDKDKIKTLSNFFRYVDSKIEKNFRVLQKDNHVSLPMTEEFGSKVIFFFFYSGRWIRRSVFFNCFERKSMEWQFQRTTLIYKRIVFFINGR